ncbi:MAG: molybdopterin-synthase adenylyltransferase MoeB [Anaeromyxobacter sp.]|nr:molybdopterin-synthase adenylyltransferase MoeB [Anaeromyxobacter sp.]MBL0277405.1 molybdopterin-synthase adenylyltransferase MoeB [Anaeromyxobacter sp.]
MHATGTDGLPELTPAEYQRYARHLILPEVGLEGQRRLKGARVLLVGAGGLGSPVALYLAAAGVGHLGLVDFDTVDASNLQRQVLHGTGDVGRLKLDSARDRLADLNPGVHVEGHPTRLDRGNALELVRAHDLVVDGTDTFATRYLTNDACVLAGKPNVYGSVFRFEGQASVFATAEGPCYRCLYPEPPPPGLVPSCAEGGVLGVLPGLVGLIQATEALKLLLGAGEPLIGRLLLVDALAMSFRQVKVRRDPRCPACGTREITELQDYEQLCGGPARPPPAEEADLEIGPAELARRLAAGDPLDLVDVREPTEWALCRLPGARLAPLSCFPDAVASFRHDREVVLYCHHGVRSLTALRRLQEAGLTRLRSLAGGIDRWSVEVDPAVPRY